MPRRRRPFRYAVPLVTAAALAACSGSPAPTASSSSPPTTESATPTPTPSPTPQGLSAKPVLAVKIDNTPAAFPRIGLSKADVVYVEPVEAGLTRLLAIFDSTMPPKVGPVRSARESDVDLLANYGPVAFAYSGASNYTQRIVVKGAQRNVAYDTSTKGYIRDHSRHAPYNVVGFPDQLLARAGGSVPPTDPGWRFGDAPAGGKPASGAVASWGAATVQVRWDAALKRYRVVTDRRAEIDALDRAPVTAASVVIQRVVMRPSGNHDVNGQVTPVETLTGTGAVTVLRDGMVWTGRWTRSGKTAPTLLTATGTPIPLAQGPVWVLLIPTTRTVTVR